MANKISGYPMGALSRVIKEARKPTDADVDLGSSGQKPEEKKKIIKKEVK